MSAKKFEEEKMSREKYILSQKNYELVKKVHLDNIPSGFIILDDEPAIVLEDVNDALHAINVELLMFGLDDDDSPNSYGYDLYRLYDEIFFNDNPIEVE